MLHAIRIAPRHPLTAAFLIGLSCASSIAATPTALSAKNPAPNQAQLSQNYGKFPLSFEANQGQSAPSVKFLSRGNGYSLYLTDSAAVLSLSKSLPSNKNCHPERSEGSASSKLHEIQNSVSCATAADTVRMELTGANPHATAAGTDQLPGISNYFIGNDPAKWHSNIPTYAKVRYTGVYPGVDLVYYGNQRQLEYDFVVVPGASPNSIRLNFAGQQRILLAANGDLILQGANGQATLHRPDVYQERQGQRLSIPASFQIAATHSVRFRIGSYDHTRPLVIDPVLTFATYLGGTGGDNGNAIAVDSNGSAYVAGTTTSADFPVTSGAYQSTNHDGYYSDSNRYGYSVFVSKFDATGTALVYSTYLGGSGTALTYGGDRGYALAVDAQGNAYVAGTAFSTDFPVTAGAFQSTNNEGSHGDSTGFVTKLNSTGTALIYSTYLGGGDSGYSYFFADQVLAVALDASGNAYLTGNTTASDFPVTPGTFQQQYAGQDYAINAFVTKLNATGTGLVYSTYLGGSGVSPGVSENLGDSGQAIAVDSAGDAYVTGLTTSPNFPLSENAYQSVNLGADCLHNINAGCGGSNAFVTKLNPTATSLLYSTYLGGNAGGSATDVAATDAAYTIAIDASGDAYVAGTTNSLDFPVTPGVIGAAGDSNGAGFLTKLNPAGSALIYSTFFGNGNAKVASIGLDSAGKTYLTGSAPGGIMTTSDAIPAQSCCAYVAKLNAAATSLEYSTYLGGAPAGSTVSQAIALDASGNAYLTGNTESLKFPITAGAYQATNKGGGSQPTVFVAKLALAAESTDHFGTTSIIAVSPASLQQGQTETVTATISPVAGGVTPSGIASFTQQYFNPNQPNPTTLPPANVVLDVAGEAIWKPSTATPGEYSVSAVYKGDGAHFGSQSGSALYTVFGPPAVLTLAAQRFGGSSVYGNPRNNLSCGAYLTDSVGDPLSGVSVTYSGAELAFSPNPAITNQGYVYVVATPLHVGSFTPTIAAPGVATPLACMAINATPAPLTVTVRNAGKVYGAALPTLSSIISGLVGSDTVTVTPQTTATSASPVGSYPVTATVTGPYTTNYNITVIAATLTVNKAPLYISAKNFASTYGQAPAQPTGYLLTGFVNGDTASVVSGAPALTTTVTNTTPVGIYKIGVQVGTLTAANYYFDNFSSGEGAVYVVRAPLYIAAKSITTTYGQAPAQPTGYLLTGFVNGETASVVSGAPALSTSVTATTPAGTYPISVGVGTLSAANYSFNTHASGEGAVQVAKAPLTIHPASVTIHAGDPLPTFTYSITGFVNGDTQASATTGAPTLTTTAPNTNTPGRYYIVANTGSLAAHNYAFNQPNPATDGILTILAN